MSRARAYDVAIAFGLAMVAAGQRCPIQPRPHGAGWDAIIPMEFIEGLPGLRPFLAPREPVAPEPPDPEPYEPDDPEDDD